MLLIFVFTISCGPDSLETASVSSGTYIENIGSDTIVIMAFTWAKKYPDVRISVTSEGSGMRIASLIN